MKTIPQTPLSWRSIYEISRTKVHGDLLLAAIKWEIFDLLIEPITSEQVAEKRGFHPGNTELFLNCLAGLDLIRKQNCLFSNTQRATEFLTTLSPTYLGAFVVFMSQWYNHYGADVKRLVENGPNAGPSADKADDLGNEALWAEGARCAAPYQYCGSVPALLEIVRGLPRFPKMKKMLDIGGGAGFYTLAIVAAHGDMTGIVFDQPAVARVAQEFIREYDAEERVSVLAGDYRTDDLGNGYDLVLACATLNFAKPKLSDIVQRVHSALNPGGTFIVCQDGISHERTRPVCHIANHLVAELSGMDVTLEQGMVADAMVHCGFISVRSMTLDAVSGVMDLDVAVKKGPL